MKNGVLGISCCEMAPNSVPKQDRKERKMEEKIITSPLKIIRAKCLDCSGGAKRDVRECKFPDCPLYPFRMGKNPYRAGLVNSGSFVKKHG